MIRKGRRAIIEISEKVKKIYRAVYIDDLKREVRALKILSKYNHFPKLLEVGDNYIVISYDGKIVNKKDRGNYKNQALELLSELEEAGIEHRDAESVHWREINGKLYLIDFGACSFRGEDVPKIRKFKYKMTDREWVDVLFK